MRLNSYTTSAVLALMVLVLVLTINPVLSYQFSQNAQVAEQSMEFVQPETLIAARGCDGARQAKDDLQDALESLRDVRDEGKYIGRAIDSIREALAQVNQHLRRERC